MRKYFSICLMLIVDSESFYSLSVTSDAFGDAGSFDAFGDSGSFEFS